MTIYVNDKIVDSFKFPGGEIQVQLKHHMLNGNYYYNDITAYLYNSDDIMRLMLTVDALKRLCDKPIILQIPYFPYARQDRICNYGESLSIEVMKNIIKSLGVKRICIYDPHSRCTSDNLPISQTNTIYDILLNEYGLDWFLNRQFILPDKGAKEKIDDIGEFSELNLKSFSKKRCVETGRILEIIEDYPTIPFHDNLIVIDDICDGGRTFIELAKVISKKTMYEKINLELYVTHGIFSNGLEELKQYFDHIYCYHTFLKESEIDTDFLTVFSTHRRPENEN